VLQEVVKPLLLWTLVIVAVLSLCGMAQAARVVVVEEVPSQGVLREAQLIQDGAVVSRMYFAPDAAWFDNIPVRFECAGGEGLVSIAGDVYRASELSVPSGALLASWGRLTAEEAALLQEWGEALAAGPGVLACDSGVYGASPACNQATLDAALAVAAAAAACAEGGPASCTVATLAALRAIQREWEICLQG